MQTMQEDVAFQALGYLEAFHPKVAWEAIKTTLKPRERNARRYLMLVSSYLMIRNESCMQKRMTRHLIS